MKEAARTHSLRPAYGRTRKQAGTARSVPD
jgi:hypothetical protein